MMTNFKTFLLATSLVAGLGFGVSNFVLAAQTAPKKETPQVSEASTTAPKAEEKKEAPMSLPPVAEEKKEDVKAETKTEVTSEAKVEEKKAETPALTEPKKPEEPKKEEPKKEDPKKEVKKEDVKKEDVKKPVAKKATPKKPVPLSKKEQDAILKKVQDHIRSIRTMKARFKQTAEVYSKDLTGTLYVMRPGRLRFEYDPPIHDFIVADGRFIYFYDSELKTASHTLISNTLAAFLIQDDADLFKGNIEVIDMVVNEATSKKLLGITVIDGKSPEQGRLTLIFEQKPAFKLVKWQVVDANGYVTQVELEKIERDIEINKDLFKYIPKNIAKPGYN